MYYVSEIIDLMLKMSGVFAILIAWLIVVLPALRYGIDLRRQTITSATCLDKRVSRIITSGLIVGAISQGIFTFYIVDYFQIPMLRIGNITYLTTNIATILASIFHFNRHPKVHSIFVSYYFIFCPLSIGLIGFYVLDTHNFLTLLSMIILSLYVIGELLLLKKFKSSAYLEIYAFILLSIWTLAFTIS